MQDCSNEGGKGVPNPLGDLKIMEFLTIKPFITFGCGDIFLFALSSGVQNGGYNRFKESPFFVMLVAHSVLFAMHA